MPYSILILNTYLYDKNLKVTTSVDSILLSHT